MDRAAPLALCCLIRVVTGSDYFWLAATTNRPLGISQAPASPLPASEIQLGSFLSI